MILIWHGTSEKFWQGFGLISERIINERKKTKDN